MKINPNIGGTLIIAGTAIGAGMLVLPIIISPLGIWLGAGLLCLVWACMTYAAIISLDLFLQFPKNCSIASIGKDVLGNFAEIISLLAISLLFYSLLSAYISASSEIITTYLQILGKNVPSILISVIITLLFGSIVYFSVSAIDLSNRVLLLLKTIFFIILITITVPYCSLEVLLHKRASSDMSWPALALALPVLFTSFGFHGSIPSIVEYMKRDGRKIKRALLIGSIIPLVVFLIWIISAMSVLPSLGQLNILSLGAFITALGATSEHEILSDIIAGFSFMAISTSFLGVALSLFDFIIERFQYDKNSRKDRLQAAFMTFTLPLLLTIIQPQLFIAALGFAAIALCIIAIIIPVSCAIRMDGIKHPKILLWLMLLFGMMIICVECYNIIQGA